MDKNILVSIITPAYNSAKFISETINSVLNQTYQEWELIIVDDCSTDNTVDILSSFVQNDSRIKMIVQSNNMGSAVARNIGLDMARGRFIAFLDSDDIWLPNKLEQQINFMLKNYIPISFTEYVVCSEDLREEHYSIKIPVSINYKGYLKNTIIGMSTSVIDRNIVESFSFHNIRTRQDTYLWITLLKRGHIAYGLKENLVKYRIRKDSISANKIKAAKRVWFLYYNLEKLGFWKSLYYFSNYAFNAIKKRG